MTSCNRISFFQIRGISLASSAIVSALTLVACGGDNSSPDGTAGTGNNAGTPGNGGTESTSGSSSGGSTSAGTSSGGSSSAGTSSGGSATGGSGGAAGICSHTPIPPGGTLTDFDPWTPAGATKWGEMNGLTGGDFQYGDAASTPVSALTATVTDGVLHLTGSVRSYAGYGLWFGPCSDASMYTGISFSIGGTIGETGEVELQFQTSNNYPEEATKGECEGTFSSGCGFAKIDNVTVPATPATYQAAFAAAMGGMPEAGVDATELLGIQFQFNCAADPAVLCEVDVTIDDLTFYQ